MKTNLPKKASPPTGKTTRRGEIKTVDAKEAPRVKTLRLPVMITERKVKPSKPATKSYKLARSKSDIALKALRRAIPKDAKAELRRLLIVSWSALLDGSVKPCDGAEAIILRLAKKTWVHEESGEPLPLRAAGLHLDHMLSSLSNKLLSPREDARRPIDAVEVLPLDIERHRKSRCEVIFEGKHTLHTVDGFCFLVGELAVERGAVRTVVSVFSKYVGHSFFQYGVSSTDGSRKSVKTRR